MREVLLLFFGGGEGFGYRVNVGRRQERWLKRELRGHALMPRSSSVLSLLNTAGWPERAGKLRLLRQPCSCALLYYFLQWENSHVPSEAGAASWPQCPGPLARCSLHGAPCDAPFPCDLRASGAEKNTASRSLQWHQEDLGSLPQPDCYQISCVILPFMQQMWNGLDLILSFLPLNSLGSPNSSVIACN